MTGPRQEGREFSEASDSLVRITLGPLIWAMHFVVSYASAAVYCSRWGRGTESIAGFRIGIGVMTAVALAAIAWVGWRAWRQWNAEKHRTGRQVLEDLVEEREGRHEFLGHAALLLAIISFVGVVYTALPAAMIGTCG